MGQMTINVKYVKIVQNCPQNPNLEFMGERKGQLKWYPPDFDPQKHKSLDAYHGTHPLRERAKKLDKGILIIRFEMPYDIWCGGCGIHIAQSVRYNAEKSKVGMYYTTPVWQFRMRCHLCPQYFIIKTDPANHDYVIISGARRKEKRWDPKENEQIVPDDKNDIKKMKLDPMFNLEHGTDDKAKLKAKLPDLADIEQSQSKWRDDDLLNREARNMFRSEKKVLKGIAEKDESLLKKSSLDIELVKEHEDDVKMASLLKYSSAKTYDEKQEEKRLEIVNRPIFTPTTTSLTLVTPGISSTSLTLVTPGTSSTSSDDSIVTPNERSRKINATKKKLGLKPPKLQTEAFDVNKGTELAIKSSLKGLKAGIVKKSDKVLSKSAIPKSNCDIATASSESPNDAGNDLRLSESKLIENKSSKSADNIRHLKQVETFTLDKSHTQIQTISTDSAKSTGKSLGLGSLIASYSSSEEGSEPD